MLKQQIKQQNSNLVKNINFLTIFKSYKIRTSIFYFLTIISSLTSYLIDQNSLNKFLRTAQNSKANYSFDLDIGFFKLNSISFNNKTRFFIFFLLLILFYSVVVFFHIDSCFQLSNRLKTTINRNLINKFFFSNIEKNKESKKNIQNLITISSKLSNTLVLYPNQLFYISLDTFIPLFLIYKKTKSVKLVLSSLLILSVISIISYICLLAPVNKIKKEQNALIEEQNKALFIIENRDLIIKKNLEQKYIKQFNKSLKKSEKTSISKDSFSTFSNTVNSYFLIKIINYIFLMLFIEFLEKKTNLSLNYISDLTSVFQLFIVSVSSVKKMCERLKEYSNFVVYKKFYNELMIEEERDDIQNNILITENITKIEFKNVSFSYDKNLPNEKKTYVFKDLNKTFTIGTINKLEGKNGTGKSTMISLIMGLLKPDSGEIIINDNFLLSQINLLNFRSKMLYSEHKNLVQKNISTGQKQIKELKLIINLAKQENKNILIMDEADNSISVSNKNLISKELEELKDKKIIILVRH